MIFGTPRYVGFTGLKITDLRWFSPGPRCPPFGLLGVDDRRLFPGDHLHAATIAQVRYLRRRLLVAGLAGQYRPGELLAEFIDQQTAAQPSGGIRYHGRRCQFTMIPWADAPSASLFQTTLTSSETGRKRVRVHAIFEKLVWSYFPQVGGVQICSVDCIIVIL